MSLEAVLPQILVQFKFPISLSLINRQLQNRKEEVVSEQFLIQHKNLFALHIIGSDLKIMLREQIDKKSITLDSLTAMEINTIIEKDLKKMKILGKMINESGGTGILYEDLVNLNAKKNNFKLDFLVQNSHAIQILSQNQKTYIKMIEHEGFTVDMCDEDVFILLLNTKSFETILVRCVESLLGLFCDSVELASLQRCYLLSNHQFGRKIMKKYNSEFVSVHNESVQLTSQAWQKRNAIRSISGNYVLSLSQDIATMKFESTCSENQNYPKDAPMPKSSSATNKSKRKKTMKKAAREAIEKSNSLMIVSNSDKEPVLLGIDKINSQSYLTALKQIQHVVKAEISKFQLQPNCDGKI